MKVLPLLMKPEMVRPTLKGLKTVTRRVLKDQSLAEELFDLYRCGEWDRRPSPYGLPGDRLYVKETWRPVISHHCAMDACDCADVNITYAADGGTRYFSDWEIDQADPDWTLPKAAERGNVSPFFLPRWASRILLEVTGVRIERLREIEAAADGGRSEVLAEGLSWLTKDNFITRKYGISDVDGLPGGSGWPWSEWDADPIAAFRKLWDGINAARGFGYDSDPYVWVVNFRVLEIAGRPVTARELAGAGA